MHLQQISNIDQHQFHTTVHTSTNLYFWSIELWSTKGCCKAENLSSVHWPLSNQWYPFRRDFILSWISLFLIKNLSMLHWSSPLFVLSMRVDLFCCRCGIERSICSNFPGCFWTPLVGLSVALRILLFLCRVLFFSFQPRPLCFWVLSWLWTFFSDHQVPANIWNLQEWHIFCLIIRFPF